mmetsp:Transcript_20596/g.66014  ORF Transcript_20596/g.66014 Transcript_20596/m.66014 type:complete len:294 (+) Transcript_20596:155-1036(+)
MSPIASVLLPRHACLLPSLPLAFKLHVHRHHSRAGKSRPPPPRRRQRRRGGLFEAAGPNSTALYDRRTVSFCRKACTSLSPAIFQSMTTCTEPSGRILWTVPWPKVVDTRDPSRTGLGGRGSVSKWLRLARTASIAAGTSAWVVGTVRSSFLNAASTSSDRVMGAGLALPPFLPPAPPPPRFLERWPPKKTSSRFFLASGASVVPSSRVSVLDWVAALPAAAAAAAAEALAAWRGSWEPRKSSIWSQRAISASHGFSFSSSSSWRRSSSSRSLRRCSSSSARRTASWARLART